MGHSHLVFPLRRVHHALCLAQKACMLSKGSKHSPNRNTSAVLFSMALLRYMSGCHISQHPNAYHGWNEKLDVNCPLYFSFQLDPLLVLTKKKLKPP